MNLEHVGGQLFRIKTNRQESDQPRVGLTLLKTPKLFCPSQVLLCGRLRRKIERAVERFIQRQQLFLFYPKDSDYRIEFITDNVQYGYVLCELYVRICSKRWTGEGLGKSAYSAFLRAFAQMRPQFPGYDQRIPPIVPLGDRWMNGSVAAA
jgi:hypothetical protein